MKCRLKTSTSLNSQKWEPKKILKKLLIKAKILGIKRIWEEINVNPFKPGPMENTSPIRKGEKNNSWGSQKPQIPHNQFKKKKVQELGCQNPKRGKKPKGGLNARKYQGESRSQKWETNNVKWP